jgi:hypothetical protein
MKIGDGTEATMDTTLNSTTRILSAARPSAGLRGSVAGVLRRLRTAIVDGPTDGCWRSIGSATPLELLPRREQERLLAAGRVPNRR